jgi:CRISPR-associated endonuclease Cas2
VFFVVAYDISDDQRRAKLAKTLEDFGDRAQYSVFEMVLNHYEQLDELRPRIEQLIDPTTDVAIPTSVTASRPRQKQPMLVSFSLPMPGEAVMANF